MKTGASARQQTMGQILGGSAVAAVLALFMGVDLSPRSLVVAIFAGVIMGLGILFQLRAFHAIGVSRQMTLTTGLQLVGISLSGILLFGEWVGSVAMPVGVFGIATLVAGIAMASWTEQGDLLPSSEAQGEPFTLAYAPEVDLESNSPDSGMLPSLKQTLQQQKQLRRKGIADTLISTAMFVSFLVIIRYFDVNPLRSFLPEAVGMLLVAFIGTSPLFHRDSTTSGKLWVAPTFKAMVPGIMWGTGLVIVQVSQIKVGVAVGFALSQLGVIISTFGGIAWLGEKRSPKEMKVISAGVVLLVLGTVILALAKSLDSP